MLSKLVYVAIAIVMFSRISEQKLVASDAETSIERTSAANDQDSRLPYAARMVDTAAQQNIQDSSFSSGKWFSNRLLRNPGLVNDVANSADECIKRCLASSGCSAVSYQLTSRVCLRSMCNNLDLYHSTGWSTFVLNVSYVEGVHLPAAQFEWMLTDTCGALNQGVASGPKMNLHSVTYTPSLSVSAGRAALFAGSKTSYGVSDIDTRLNNVMGKGSHTIMFWVNWSQTPTVNTLFEYQSGGHRSFLFWLYGGGLWYDLSPNYMGTTVGCTANCASRVPFQPVIHTWYHVAYAYDGSEGEMSTYLNGRLVGFNKVGQVPHGRIWDLARVGYTPFNEVPMPGNIYCLKVLNAALTFDQVSAFAQSCVYGKIRFSN